MKIINTIKDIFKIHKSICYLEITSILKFNLKNNENKDKVYINPNLLNNYIDLSTKWVNGKISTFTFLNILNILSNRSLKD